MRKQQADRSEVPAPMFISSRLMAAVKIGETDTVHIEWTGESDSCGRAKVHYIVETGSGTPDERVITEGDGLATHGGYAEAMGTLLVFLGAFAEALDYQRRTGRKSDNADMFPIACAEWACEHSEEIDTLAFDLENPEQEQKSGAEVRP